MGTIFYVGWYFNILKALWNFVSLSLSLSLSLTVAQQCLSEAYGIDLGDASQRAKYEVKPTLEVFKILFNRSYVQLVIHNFCCLPLYRIYLQTFQCQSVKM